MARVVASGLTDVGRRRQHNEDAFLCDPELGLFVVADGLGGHAAGEVASNEAVETIHGWVLRERDALRDLAANPHDPSGQAEVRALIERAVMAATYHVFAIAEYDARKAGMGTTVSALVIAGSMAVTAQVGDSRVYRVRDGVASQMTDDHTLVAAQIRDGLITPEEAKTARHRNVITRAVGSHEYVQVDTGAFPAAPGDRYLLCTDGLHGYVTDPEIPSIVALEPDVAARKLIDLANQRGGKDNITAVVIHLLK